MTISPNKSENSHLYPKGKVGLTPEEYLAKHSINWEKGAGRIDQNILLLLIALLGASVTVSCILQTLLVEDSPDEPQQNDHNDTPNYSPQHVEDTPVPTVLPTIGPEVISTPSLSMQDIVLPVSFDPPEGLDSVPSAKIEWLTSPAQITELVRSFDQSQVYSYPEPTRLEVNPGFESGYTIIGAFDVKDENGGAIGQIGVVTSGIEALPHWAERFVAPDGTISWVVLTPELEVIEGAVPGQDGLVDVVGWDNPAQAWGVFVGSGVATPRLLAELDDDGKPTGKLMYCGQSQEKGQFCSIIPIEADGDDSDVSSKVASPALILDTDLVEQMNRFNVMLHTLGIDTEGRNYEYHPEGDLGLDVGNGVFLTVDGNAVIYVGDSSFDEVDPDLLHTKDGKVVAIDGYQLDQDGVWVEIPISETAIVADTEIEGNPFNGQGIELKMLNEITLDPEGDDLMHMADMLDQLAAEGKITVKPVTDQRGAMQLGPSADKVPDLVIQDESAANDWWGPMYMVQDYDLRTFRWQDVTTRPVLIGFNNADGGVIFATMMVDGSGSLKVTDWKIAPEGWNGYFGDGLIKSIINYGSVSKMSLKKTVPVPVDFADVDACVEYAMDEGMRGTCEKIVANRSDLRTAYEAMVRTGKVQPDLRNAKSSLTGETLITLLGFTPAHK